MAGKETEGFTAAFTDDGDMVKITKDGGVGDAITNLGGKISRVRKGTENPTEDPRKTFTLEDLDELEQKLHELDNPDPNPISDGKEIIDVNGTHYDKDGNVILQGQSID